MRRGRSVLMTPDIVLPEAMVDSVNGHDREVHCCGLIPCNSCCVHLLRIPR